MRVLAHFLALCHGLAVFGNRPMSSPVDSSCPVPRRLKIDYGISNAEKIVTAVEILLTGASTHVIDSSISTNCRRDLQFIQRTWAKLQECASQECAEPYNWMRDLLDSQGKRPSGVELGNRYWLGAYKQCTSVSTTYRNMEKLESQYCKASLLTESIGEIELGLCFPVSCSANDIRAALSDASQVVNDFDVSCDKPSSDMSGALAVLIGCAVQALIWCAATIFDLRLLRHFIQMRGTQDKESVVLNGFHLAELKTPTVRSLLSNFSFLSNGAKLLSCGEHGQISCLNGMKWLSCFWLLFLHSAPMIDFVENPKTMLTYGNIGIALFFPSFFSVDTFFALGGFLLSYNFLKRLKPGNITTLKDPNFWFAYYVGRYVRLTIPYGFLLWIYHQCFHHLASGPFWNSVNHDVCPELWWRHMFYVLNFVDDPRYNGCLEHVWYIQNDYWFYAISPIILIPLAILPRLGYSLAAAFLIFDIVARGAGHGLNNLPPLGLYGLSKRYNESRLINWIAHVPYYRYGPYIIGLLGGHIFLTWIRNPIRHGRVFLLTGWTFTIVAWILTPLPYVIEYLHPLPNAVYTGLIRIAMAGSSVWVIYTCATGHCDLVNRILCWKPFQQLNKLGFSVYLIHVLVYIYLFRQGETALHFDGVISVISMAAACFTVTMPLAVLFCLGVEMPVAALANTIQSYRFRKKVRKNGAD